MPGLDVCTADNPEVSTGIVARDVLPVAAVNAASHCWSLPASKHHRHFGQPTRHHVDINEAAT